MSHLSNFMSAISWLHQLVYAGRLNRENHSGSNVTACRWLLDPGLTLIYRGNLTSRQRGMAAIHVHSPSQPDWL